MSVSDCNSNFSVQKHGIPLHNANCPRPSKKSYPWVKEFLFTLYHVLNVLPLERCTLNTSHQSM